MASESDYNFEFTAEYPDHTVYTCRDCDSRVALIKAWRNSQAMAMAEMQVHRHFAHSVVARVNGYHCLECQQTMDALKREGVICE